MWPTITCDAISEMLKDDGLHCRLGLDRLDRFYLPPTAPTVYARNAACCGFSHHHEMLSWDIACCTLSAQFSKILNKWRTYSYNTSTWQSKAEVEVRLVVSENLKEASQGRQRWVSAQIDGSLFQGENDSVSRRCHARTGSNPTGSCQCHDVQ